MGYLSETVKLYRDANGGLHEDVEHDEYSFEVYAGDVPVTYEGDKRDATWWTVAIYDVWDEYGGPEEGGWYYQAGSLREATVRYFTSYEDAEACLNEMWDWIADGLIVKGLTEEMPPAYFPKHRPYYH